MPYKKIVIFNALSFLYGVSCQRGTIVFIGKEDK